MIQYQSSARNFWEDRLRIQSQQMPARIKALTCIMNMDWTQITTPVKQALLQARTAFRSTLKSQTSHPTQNIFTGCDTGLRVRALFFTATAIRSAQKERQALLFCNSYFRQLR